MGLLSKSKKEPNRTLECSYCGGKEFFEGPQAGMSQNILCANSECRHWFNWTAALASLEDLNSVEPTEEERQTEKDAKQVEFAEKIREMMAAGAGTYERDESPFTCLDERPPYRGELQHDLYRLAGFLEALQKDVQELKEKSH